MKKKSTTYFFKVLLIASLVSVVSCGDDDDSTSVVINPDDTQREEQEGTSAGPTVIINNRIVNNAKFNNRTRVSNDNLVLSWQCQDVPPVVHQQFIHIAVRCPSIADDTNADGYVDPVELQQVLGPRVYALDSDLSSPGQASFPNGSSYEYNQSIPISQVQEIVSPGQDFAVVVHGADPSTQLPPTYTTLTNDPAYLTVPILCKTYRYEVTTNGQTNGGTTGGTTTGETTTGGTTTGGTTTGDTTTGGTTTGTTTTGGETNGGTTTGGETNGGTTTGGETNGTTTGGETNGGTTTGGEVR